MRNRIGELFSVTTFGESHGAAIGGVIDGMPAGVKIDVYAVQQELDRRRPGQSAITTTRKEPDKVELLSGILDGVTLGTPIGFIIRNKDQHSNDYSEIANCYRPSHADYTYEAKYGLRDARGGGRTSARETAARVVAGAIAKQALKQLGVTIVAFTSQVGDVTLDLPLSALDLANCDSNIVRCPDDDTASRMIAKIEQVKSEGDTIGGRVTCVVKGVPAGWGEPVFGKLQASLAQAMMSINAAKGFEYGLGFGFAEKHGSESLDHFVVRDNGKIGTRTNNSGGIQGGISNGEDIYFNVVFKPVATLMRDIETIDRNGNTVTLHARGRHDPCVVARAVPIVEAMAAIILLDNYLLNKTTHL